MSDLASLVGGRLVGDDRPFARVITDSRLPAGPDDLFFALQGPRHDGHRYMAELAARGVRCFCCQPGTWPAGAPQNVTCVACASPLGALQALAANHRQQLTARVVAIVGSNGKTIVKEWLAELLGDDRRTARSPRSYNSQIGVALSLLDVDGAAQLALIEAGISEPGEMAHLEAMVRPDDVLFTHLGTAHDEGFESAEQKAGEKLLMASRARRVVYCADDARVSEAAARLPASVQRVAWSERADTVSLPQGAQASLWRMRRDGTDRLTLREAGGPAINLPTPLHDNASIENLTTAALYAHLAGVADTDIARRAADLRPLTMRLEQKDGLNGCTLLDDSYSADIASLRVALDQLTLLGSRKGLSLTLVASDMATASPRQAAHYSREVAELCRQKGVTRLVWVGCHGPESFPGGQLQAFLSTDELLAHLSTADFHNEAVLIKGARRHGLERLSNRLAARRNRTRLEVNMTALANNIGYFRSRLPAATRLLCMVKAYSYGTGGFEIARLMEREGVDYLGVAFADEGRELREAGIALPIVVMNPEEHSYDLMLREGLEPEITGWSCLEGYSRAAQEAGVAKANVHVKFNTGMTRSGFEPAEAASLARRTQALGNLRVVSAFSHLVESEDPTADQRTLRQIQTFRDACETLEEGLAYSFLRHILNSAGIERFPQHHLEMARLGIGLYGLSALNAPQLRNVCSLKSYISLLRPTPAGEGVGYNRRTILRRDSLIAVVPIGYADGLDRRLSNGNGTVIIKGHTAPIVGNVCMDICMVDVTDIAGVAEGDEVELFGDQQPVWAMADKCGTICYEILTGISRRVPRVYVVE